MPFEQTISPIEAYRNPDSVRLVVKNREYQIPLPTARTLCDLLSITIYDESIVALMAKRRRLSHENELLKVSTISGKIKIIRCSLKWSAIVEGGYSEDKYLVALKSQYEGAFDIGEFLGVLDEVDKWREYRNEIMHALLNKNIESLWEELASQTEKGMQLARKLDAYVKLVKKNNRIRKAIKLPVNR